MKNLKRIIVAKDSINIFNRGIMLSNKTNYLEELIAKDKLIKLDLASGVYETDKGLFSLRALGYDFDCGADNEQATNFIEFLEKHTNNEYDLVTLKTAVLGSDIIEYDFEEKELSVSKSVLKPNEVELFSMNSKLQIKLNLAESNNSYINNRLDTLYKIMSYFYKRDCHIEKLVSGESGKVEFSTFGSDVFSKHFSVDEFNGIILEHKDFNILIPFADRNYKDTFNLDEFAMRFGGTDTLWSIDNNLFEVI